MKNFNVKLKVNYNRRINKIQYEIWRLNDLIDYYEEKIKDYKKGLITLNQELDNLKRFGHK